jgi:hypothetical protein
MGAVAATTGDKMTARFPVRPDFGATIPAQPGFYMLGVLGDGDGFPFEVIQYPVVAWALETESFAPYPVTLEGVQFDNVAILQPDGVVEIPCVGGYPSVAEWLADQQAKHGARKLVR